MYHTGYDFLGTLLVALVSVKYQASNTDPFHEHPTIMLLFLIVTFTYVIALTELKLPADNNPRSPILRVICHVSGLLANELLLLILVKPLCCFTVNVSSFLLVQALCYCSQYVSPLFNLLAKYLGWIWYFGRKVEQPSANAEIIDLEAGVKG